MDLERIKLLYLFSSQFNFDSNVFLSMHSDIIFLEAVFQNLTLRKTDCFNMKFPVKYKHQKMCENNLVSEIKIWH